MDTLSYKTVSANSATVNKEWLLVDAEGQELGRLASIVASKIRGKHKANFTPHVDCGDNVVVINSDKVVLTGNKLQDKEYLRYSGYPGGQRAIKASDQLRKDSTVIIEKAVRGMLPKNRLGRQLFNNLFVYTGAEHKQQAQKPKKLDINKIK